MLPRLSLPCCLLLPAIAVRAETFCVGTAAGLQAGLDTAESNGEDDLIQLLAGTYAPTSGGAAFRYRATENRRLTVRGGHTQSNAGHTPFATQASSTSTAFHLEKP